MTFFTVCTGRQNGLCSLPDDVFCVCTGRQNGLCSLPDGYLLGDRVAAHRCDVTTAHLPLPYDGYHQCQGNCQVLHEGESGNTETRAQNCMEKNVDVLGSLP